MGVGSDGLRFQELPGRTPAHPEDAPNRALRPLLPRVVAPLEGRSSGSRIIRFCAPSRFLAGSSGSMRRSSPVTATGSRRIHTGFPLTRSTSIRLFRAGRLRLDPVPFVPLAQALHTREPLGITLHRRWFERRVAHGPGRCNRRRARRRSAADCAVCRNLRWRAPEILSPLFENAQSNRWFAETISDGMALATFVLAKVAGALATKLPRDHEQSAERRRTRAPVGKSSDDRLHSTTE